MQESELFSLIRKVQARRSEFQTVEIKACRGGFPKIYDTLSSFSNQDDGGVILFGIMEKADYAVVGVYDVEDAQKKAMEACNQMQPKVRAVFTQCDIDGKIVLSAEIPGVESVNRPVYYAGVGRLKGSFIRVGDADELMSEYEIYSYEAFKRRTKDELRKVPEANLSLFNQDSLRLFLNSVKKERPNLASNVSDNAILELMGITADRLPTLAGVLAFSLYPQTWFPQLCITAVSVPGSEMGDTDEDGARFLDNRRITGCISDMLEEAIEFVRKNSRTKTIIDENGKRKDKPEYPLLAVREAVLNALLHRDYSIYTENTPVSIEMYRNRIEIISKGGLYGGGSVNQLGKGHPDTRNPVIMNILELLNISENRYSGIPTIYRECSKAGLPAPKFEVIRGTFRVTFWNDLNPSGNDIDKTNLSEAVIQFCRIPRTREELTSFTGKSRYYTMSAIIQPLVEQGKLRMTLPEKPKSPKQQYAANNF